MWVAGMNVCVPQLCPPFTNILSVIWLHNIWLFKHAALHVLCLIYNSRDVNARFGPLQCKIIEITEILRFFLISHYKSIDMLSEL